MMYRNLKAEMARNNLNMGHLADLLEVRRATISDKMNGKNSFYYDEAKKIKETYFPSFSIEYLFETDDANEIISSREKGVC